MGGIVVIMITGQKPTSQVLGMSEAIASSNAYLEEFLSQELIAAQAIDQDYAQLLQTIQEYVAGGGKRIRPYMTLLAYCGYGGTDVEGALPAACAWELLHAALLVHDDIIDRDVTRHGKPNIAGVYQDIYAKLADMSVDHYALSSALLAGDLLISGSQKIVLQSNLPAEQKVQILLYLNTALFHVGGGELLDTETALRSLTSTNPRLIAQYKTASYSFVYPLLSGAYLAGADKDQMKLLNKLGNSIGIAYQLIDDLLGVFGDEHETGKTTDGDIRERKHTMLLQETYARITKQQQSQLAKLYTISEELSDDDIAHVKRIMIDSGAKDFVANQARQLTSEAEQTIAQLGIQPDYAQSILTIVEKLLKRKY